MSNKNSNYPTNQKIDCTPTEMGDKVSLFNELRKLPPVRKQEPDGVRERLNYYFKYCEERGLKPSVEGMALCLGTSRQNLWLWEQDEHSEAGQLITRAKSLINAVLTEFTMNGRLAFPYTIWLQKNHFQYADKVEITATPQKNDMQGRTPEQIAAEYGRAYIEGEVPEMPELPEFPDD